MSTTDDPTRTQIITVHSDGYGDVGVLLTERAGAPDPSSPVEEPGSPGWHLELPKEWMHSAPWRATVHRRRLMLYDDLARLPLSGVKDAERTALYQLLDDAGVACHAPVGLRTWWWGTEVERAWAALREVEERTIDLLPDDELVARAACAVAHAGSYLKADDKRLLHLEALRLEATKTQPPTRVAGMRTAIVEVLRAAHAEADRTNQEARFLRNRVLLASSFSVAFAGVVVAIQRWLGDVSLLDVPSKMVDGEKILDVAPWRFLVIVMVLGAVGALFTAIPAMSKTPSDFGPFNLPLQQALLKLSFGPVVALTGFAIANTGAIEGASPTTWPGVVLLAIVLGAGQQAVTRYVDARADEILSAAAPGTDDKK
jgi:hypothetical protein